MVYRHAIWVFFFCDDQHFTSFFLYPSILHLRLTLLIFQHRRMDIALHFSELTLKWSLGLIQLIKTWLMFVLMAPERQPHRQANVISASDEASAQSLYGLQIEEGGSQTMQYPNL